MNILLDLDGVIVDIEAGFWEKWPACVKNAPMIKPKDRKSFYIIDDLPAQYRAAAWGLMKTKNFFKDLLPVPDAIKGTLALIEAGHDVAFCTKPVKTSEYCASEKQMWIRQWFGKEHIERLVITSDKTRVRGDFLFDDSPEVIGRCTPEWQHIVFDTTYNRTSPRPRVWGWDDLQVFVRDNS